MLDKLEGNSDTYALLCVELAFTVSSEPNWTWCDMNVHEEKYKSSWQVASNPICYNFFAHVKQLI